MIRTAIFDEHKKYRYSLITEWDEGKGKVFFILLNPSLADGKVDDNTTKRCIHFAKKYGYGSLEIVNLFVYIATNYSELKVLDKNEAIGSENYNYLIRAINSADNIIVAWGENGTIHQRHKEIEQLIDGYDVDCLGVPTREGHPRHPLCLRNDVELVPYKRPKQELRKLIRTVPDNEPKSREGILIKDGKKVCDDSWIWCESCHGDFRLAGFSLCRSCFELLMEKFKDFLIQEYRIRESSAKDYVGRFKGIVKSGIYKGNNQMTPILKAAIEKKFPNSKQHYILTLERYIEFQKKM